MNSAKENLQLLKNYKKENKIKNYVVLLTVDNKTEILGVFSDKYQAQDLMKLIVEISKMLNFYIVKFNSNFTILKEKDKTIKIEIIRQIYN